MTPEEALAYLHTLPRFAGVQDAAYKPGLERMRALMEEMGRPHEAFQSTHIAGTNGKGSTAALLAAIATATGRRTGLHTSPHLFRLTERMRIDGRPAPEDWLAEAVARFHPDFEAVQPSFFEATVALSFLYFSEECVDLAVVEVGLGGRLDATNVLHPKLAIITSIGYDHTDLLGETLPEIAHEKAGIIKPGVPVVTTAAQPEAVEAIRQAAAAQEAPLHRVQDQIRVHEIRAALDGLTLRLTTPLRRYDALRVGLPGLHQQHNALAALRAAELLFDEVPQGTEAVYNGLREVKRLAGLRGRSDVLQENPLVVADVAHNPDGLSAALALLRNRPGADKGRLRVLFGAMRDKDVPAMASLLAEAGAIVTPVLLSSERALLPGELADMLNAHGATAEAPCTAPEGLARFRQQAAPEDALLIAGSHLVVAQLAGVL